MNYIKFLNQLLTLYAIFMKIFPYIIGKTFNSTDGL